MPAIWIGFELDVHGTDLDLAWSWAFPFNVPASCENPFNSVLFGTCEYIV